MKESEVFEKMKEIIMEQLGIEDASTITMDATFVDDLSADSLDIVELIMSLEEKFELEIPDEEAEKIVTVGDVVKYIVEHKN